MVGTNTDFRIVRRAKFLSFKVKLVYALTNAQQRFGHLRIDQTCGPTSLKRAPIHVVVSRSIQRMMPSLNLLSLVADRRRDKIGLLLSRGKRSVPLRSGGIDQRAAKPRVPVAAARWNGSGKRG